MVCWRWVQDGTIPVRLLSVEFRYVMGSPLFYMANYRDNVIVAYCFNTVPVVLVVAGDVQLGPGTCILLQYGLGT